VPQEYYDLPLDVGESADQAIDDIQNGRKISAKMFTSLKGTLRGVDEVRIPYDSDTYRVYVLQECEWVVIVLGAEMKKSKSGDDMPKEQKERLEARLKTARAYIKSSSGQLKKDYSDRAERAEAHKRRRR
jgi:phage-related protein